MALLLIMHGPGGLAQEDSRAQRDTVVGMTGAFEDYQEALIARHQTALTDWGSVAGEIVLLMAPGVAVRFGVRSGAVVAVGGVAIATLAHLFQPGTIADELREVARHPVWAVRAEAHRLLLEWPTRSSARAVTTTV
jgi:hypothetical protein